MGAGSRGRLPRSLCGNARRRGRAGASAGFPGHVVGADFAEPMLRAGGDKVARGRIAPVVADAVDLPIAPDAFATGRSWRSAFATSRISTRAHGRRVACSSQARRFVILEFSTPPRHVARGDLSFLFPPRAAVRRTGCISGHRTAYNYLPKSVANFPLSATLAARMRQAGFAVCVVARSHVGIAAIHVGRTAPPGMSMCLDNSHEFIAAIDAAGELVRITSRFTRISSSARSPTGYEAAGRRQGAAVRERRYSTTVAIRVSVAINLYGSMRRMALALGVDELDEIGDRITELLDSRCPKVCSASSRCCRKLLEVGEVSAAVTAGKAPCQEIDLAGRRDRSRQAADHHLLAGGRRAVHHASDGDHARSEARHPERRHVPRAGSRASARSRCTGSVTRSARRTGARWRSGARQMPV